MVVHTYYARATSFFKNPTLYVQRWYFDYKSNFTLFYIHAICILIMISTKKSGFQRIPPVRCALQISRCTVNKEITSFFSSFTWLGDERAILIPLFPSWCSLIIKTGIELRSQVIWGWWRLGCWNRPSKFPSIGWRPDWFCVEKERV